MYFDRRFLTVLGLSLIWALLVAMVFYRVAGGPGKSRAGALRQVVVATRTLPVGMLVDRASVALRGVPAAMVPGGAFTSVEDVEQRPVTQQIQSDEPLVEARLAVKGSGAGLGPLIPPGMRAVSVKVNDVVGVAGFVLPGTRVDVLVTGKPMDSGDTQTQTVLQNIAVLSAGQTTQNDAKSQPITAQTVTLLVNPTEAEALTLANSEGHIQLVLRNPTDKTVTATGGRWLRQLYGIAPSPHAAQAPMAPIATAPVVRPRPALIPVRTAAAATPPPPRPPAAPPEADRIIVIQGATRRVEVFPGAGR